MVRIGLSARFMKSSPKEFGIGGKSIQYLEQSMANSLAASGALVFLIPSIGNTTELTKENFHPEEYALAVDGLVLQGGVDICPAMYGEEPISEEIIWDSVRDRYELALVDAFVKLGKPVLGICRGMQLLNIYCGGSLYQDIPTQLKSRITHYCPDHREHNEHEIAIQDGSYLAGLYGTSVRRVNSIHHQCVKKLGRDLRVEAISSEDGLIEAFRSTRENYLVGVQWHPEFHTGARAASFDADILFRDFIKVASRCVDEKENAGSPNVLAKKISALA